MTDGTSTSGASSGSPGWRLALEGPEMAVVVLRRWPSPKTYRDGSNASSASEPLVWAPLVRVWGARGLRQLETRGNGSGGRTEEALKWERQGPVEVGPTTHARNSASACWSLLSHVGEVQVQSPKTIWTHTSQSHAQAQLVNR